MTELPGAHPSNNISIKFEIQWKFVMLLFITYKAYYNEISHTSRQCNCCDVWKISLWWVEHILNQSTPNFDQIFSLIEMPIVGWVPGLGFPLIQLCWFSEDDTHDIWDMR